MVEPESAPTSNRARIIEQTWIWSVVGYSLLRFLVAWGALAEHGVNPWIFGLIDVGTAWPYAKSVAAVAKRAARFEWSAMGMALVVAIATFFAPWAYLWFAAGSMPGGLRIGMAICVAVLFLAAASGVFAKSRKLRRDEAADDAIVVNTSAEIAPTGDVSPDTTDVADQVIDLRDHVVTDMAPDDFAS